MSLPLSHAGGSVDGISAALDLRFASSLSLTSTSGLTPSFSRASGGTFTGSDGLLKYTPLNLALYSEQFDNAAYTKSQGSIVANQAISPDGKTTADRFTASSGTVNPYAFQSVTTASGSAYTFSIYVKKETHDFVQIVLNGVANGYANFDINSGTVGTVGAGGSATASIVNAGNGWFRCVITYTTASTSGSGYINLIGSVTAGRSATFSASGTESVYLWGAQLVIGSDPGTYAQTTTTANSAPRFDHVYNGSAWVSKGLLIEEARTNNLLQSNSFTTTWTALDGVAVASSGTSPDGTNNAWKLNELATSTPNHGIYQGPIGVAGAVPCTLSVYAKSGERNWMQIASYDGSTNYFTWFNLSSGTVGTNPAGTTATITSVGNGWYRCSVSRSSNSTYHQIFAANGDNNGSYLGEVGKGIYIWGAQLEAGSFPTSYIPTTTAAVTRSADVCQITGGDFSGFWNASEGSFVTEADSIGFATTGSDRYITTFNSGGTANIAHAIFLPTTGLSFDVYNSTLQARVSYTQPNAGDLFKLASCYKANDFAATLNGSAVQTDTSGTVPTINNVGIGHYPSFNQYANCHIARLRYFNKRLTNKQLEDLCKPEEQLKLDLNFSSSLSLTPTVGPTPSYSRASTGTYFNASGVLTSAAVNEARFDHVFDGTSWVSKGLLIEEQRVNYVKYANDLSTNWTNEAGATREYNSIASPDGGTNATKVNVVVSGFSGIYQYPLSNGGSGTYTYSIFAKKGTKDWLVILNAAGSGSSPTFFNISNGTIGTVFSGYSATILDVGNGWYRCILTTASSTTPSWFQIAFVDANNSVTPASTGHSYVYGAQVEIGSFPTSYIPTVASSVVRSADVCQITGSAFTNLWNASEGSIAFEADAIDPRTVGPAQTVYSADDGNSTNSIYALRSGLNLGSDYWVASYRAGALQFNFTTAADFWPINVPFKSAIGFKLNDTAQSSKGLAVVTDTSCIVPTGLTQLTIGRLSYTGGTGFPLNGHIARLRYYAIRLPNRLLIAKSN